MLAFLSPWPRPGRLRREFLRILSKQRRRWSGIEKRTATLAPEGPPIGRALFSFIIDPFVLRPGELPSHDHTHDWESLEMARALVERGYAVDAIHWSNCTWLPDPAHRYDLIVDVRLNLERLAPILGVQCLRLFHAETAHRSVHDGAQRARHQALARRRGFDLPPNRLLEDNRAVETADAMTVLGNSFTIESYAFAGKPTWRVPISNPFLYPLPERDWESARRTFLWFGSGGLVHKGLDLVLEAFAAEPELTLLVAGPIERERGFERAFAKELYGTRNIETIGWLDVASPQFLEVARRCGALVYPSCSEGGGGSAITAMHAGMVPILTRSASVDTDPSFGLEIGGDTVEAVRTAVCAFAALDPGATSAMAQRAWSFAREHHTQESFALGWRRALDQILARRDELMGWRHS